MIYDSAENVVKMAYLLKVLLKMVQVRAEKL
jgi:hypothetical protein